MEQIIAKYTELGFASVVIIVFLWYFIYAVRNVTRINKEIFTMFKDEVRDIAECSKQNLAISDKNKSKLDRIYDNTDANLKISREIVNSQKEVARILKESRCKIETEV